MTGNTGSARRWLTAAVLAHLAVSIAHGVIHSAAQVPLAPAAMLFVFVVIVAGPLVGLALTGVAPYAGSWIVGLTMAGSLVFGCVNHFVLASPDHVSHVIESWRALFAATASLLVVTEVLRSRIGDPLCASTEDPVVSFLRRGGSRSKGRLFTLHRVAARCGTIASRGRVRRSSFCTASACHTLRGIRSRPISVRRAG